jgi:hypothetical protein
MDISKTYWYDHKPVSGDDNNGYLYGIETYDDNDNFLDVEWFKTGHERNIAFRKMLEDLEDIKNENF